MKLYYDSSYLFRLYSTEPGYREVQRQANRAETVVSAWHARAELATIFLRKRREKAASDEILSESRAQFSDDLAVGVVALIPLDEGVMKRLESVMEQAPCSTYLRASDALHLACAAEHGFKEVYSNDRHFLSAAVLFGLKGLNILSSS